MMKKTSKRFVAGVLTAAMTAGLCIVATVKTTVVTAASTTLSGLSVKTDVAFDGTWNGNYDKNYDEAAERRNSTCFRTQQKVSATLTKRMYLEADVAVPAKLVSEITSEKSWVNFNGWVDFSTNTPTDTEWYNENSNVYGQEQFSSCTTIYSNSNYNTWQNTDGKESNVDSTLVKSGSYYIVHMKSAIEAPAEVTNFKATEIAYNLNVDAVNITYDGFVIYDNIKLTDDQGKEIAGTDFEDNTSILGTYSYSNEKDVATNYVNFNSSVTSFNNVLASDFTFDAKYYSNEEDGESWRNTLATEYNISSRQFCTSPLKLKAGEYAASAVVYIPKAALNKAAIRNHMQFALQMNGCTDIKQYDGWQDFDWDTCTNFPTLGETRIIKDGSGYKYYNFVWNEKGEYVKESSYNPLPVSGDYYVVPIKNAIYLEKTTTFKGLELSLFIRTDGCDYTGTIYADDFQVTSSSGSVIYDENFDTDAPRNTNVVKADIDKPNKNDAGLVDWYDVQDVPYYMLGIDNTSASTKLNKAYATVYVGKTAKFKASVTGASDTVSYRVGNSKIAKVTVDSKGVVTVKGIKKGTTILYATANGVTTQAKITVKAPSLTLKKASTTIKKGKTTTIKATAAPSGKITYTSKNKKIATVTSKGVVKGVKKGTTTIVVKANGITKNFKITVK